MSSFGLPNARAAASRCNGAKSRGPKTVEGKARSAQNALKHGFRAQKHMVLPGENAAEFAELEAALMEELAPEGALQAALAQRVVSAIWRLSRAERLEAELFAENHLAGRSLGLALIRDCNGGARSFDTLLRYRGGTLAELWRALRTLKALQAEAEDRVRAMSERQPGLLPRQPAQTGGGEAVATPVALPPLEQAHCQTPIEPEARGNPRETASVPTTGKVVATVAPALPEEPQAHHQTPIEPEARGNPGEIALAPAADAGRGRRYEDLRAHEATQECVTNAPLGRHSCAVHASPANSTRSEAGAGGRT
jgi:hypothetical protein